MRQVREVLRLRYLCGQSGHRIAAAIGISRYTVAEYLRRAAVVGITWPVPPELDDTTLERKLFKPPGTMVAEVVRPQPDWVRMHAEMRRPGVTLLLLWEEYRAGCQRRSNFPHLCRSKIPPFGLVISRVLDRRSCPLEAVRGAVARG